MQVILYILKFYLVGIAISAPVGPIGVLCVRQTLSHGLRAGFAVGLGAAAADCLYTTLWVKGAKHFLDWMMTYKGALRGIGGLVLVIMGARELWLARPQSSVVAAPPRWQWLAAQSFFLTALNPLAILTVMVVATSLGHPPRPGLTAWGIISLFCGSLTWWGFLAFVSQHFGQRMLLGSGIRRLRLVSGGLLILCGLWAMGQEVWEMLGL